MRRPFDRRLAAGAFAMAAVAMFATVAVARGFIPEVAGRDPAAARSLEALMQAGEQGTWSVTYDFTRTLAGGRVLRQAMQEARDPKMHVLRSGSAMTVDKADRDYDCNLADGHFACTESEGGSVLPPSEVLRVAVSVGAYDVTQAPGDTFAGVRARCFRVLASGHGQLPDLGAETDLCYSATGVPLRQRVVRASGDVDERVASSVAQHVTGRSIEAIIRGPDGNDVTGPQ